jgi:hypothetical protein
MKLSIFTSLLLIGTAFFFSSVSAEELSIDEVSMEEVSTISNTPVVDPGYYACISVAVSTREESYVNRWNSYSAALSSAYATRKTSLVSAWNSADRDKVKKGIDGAAKVFKDSLLEARKAWISSEKEIITKMKSDKEACQTKYGVNGVQSIASSTISRGVLMQKVQDMLSKRLNEGNRTIRLKAK